MSGIQNQVLKPLLAVASAMCIAGCATHDPIRGVLGSYRSYKEIEGVVKDGRYFSPVGNFSCAVPQLLKPGAVIRDASSKSPDGSRGGTVGFEDDLGTLYRVDWFEVAPDLADSLPDRELFERFFNFQMVTYQKLMPGVSLEAKEFSEEATKATLYFSARIPKGSTIASNGQRRDCSRASMIIRRGNWIYSLTTQDTNVLGRRDVTVEKRTSALRSSLDKFAEGFEFK